MTKNLSGDLARYLVIMCNKIDYTQTGQTFQSIYNNSGRASEGSVISTQCHILDLIFGLLPQNISWLYQLEEQWYWRNKFYLNYHVFFLTCVENTPGNNCERCKRGGWRARHLQQSRRVELLPRLVNRGPLWLMIKKKKILGPTNVYII